MNFPNRWSALATLTIVMWCLPAQAQWQVPDHSIPIGRGSGTGFKFVGPCTAGQTIIYSGISADPACGAGSGTVSSGTINQLGVYASTGMVISGLATANSGLLVTSGAGVPSISTAIPNGVTATTQTATDSSTKVATTAFVQTKTSVGSAGAIQMAAASGAFADSTFASLTPVNGTALTGKFLQVPLIGCTGCSGFTFALLSPQSVAGFAPGGHETYVGDFLTVGGVGTGAGSVAVASEQAVVSANHCTGLGNAIECRGDSGIVIGHVAIAAATSGSGIAIGTFAEVDGTNSIAIGASALTNVTASDSIAMGANVTAASTRSIAIGSTSSIPSSCNFCIAIGYGSTATAAGHAVLGGPSTTDIYAGSDTTPVYGHFGGIFLTVPTTQTTNYSLAAYDSGVIFNCAGSCTLTIPPAGGATGRTFRVRTIASQTVVSASGNVVPLIGGAAGTAILAGTAGKWADLQSDGSNWQIMAGN